jgi:uncharacterized protein (DUF1330 family)
MKTKYAVALGMWCFALGAVAVQSLHAQAKAPAFGIFEVVVSNQEAYAKEFLPPVVKSVSDFGGKLLAVGGQTASFKGAPPAPRVVLAQWDSMDKAEAWWNSQATKDAYAIGDKYATFRIFAVEGKAQ